MDWRKALEEFDEACVKNGEWTGIILVAAFLCWLIFFVVTLW